MRRRSVLVAVVAGGLAMALPGKGTAGSEGSGGFVFDDRRRRDRPAAYRGGPVLVVNTASRCGFTGQYDGLQALWDGYRDRGLTVLGVPSDSFRQELGSAAEVADFCEVNFGIDFPMTDLVEVTGPGAHPFYAWAAAQGVAPSWNFHKILLDGEGRIVADYGARIGPAAPGLIAAIEALLPEG
jgi:glutathione peroxidase